MKKIILLFCFAFAFLHSAAQTNHVYFDWMTVRDGLPDDRVSALAEDANGYIWMGTWNGLVRYDGYQYKNYSLGSEKTNVAPVNVVSAIIIDHAKDIWVSTFDNGLFKYNRFKDTFEQFLYPATANRFTFTASVCDSGGNIWGRLRDDGSYLVKFDRKTKKFVLFGKQQKGANFINARYMLDIEKTANGDVWFCTNNGLYRYCGPAKPAKGFFTSTDTSKIQFIPYAYEAPSEPGVLWICAWHKKALKIIRFDTKSNSIKNFYAANKPDSISNAITWEIHEDKHKQLWFLTDSGLSKLDRASGTFINYGHPDGLKDFMNGMTETKNGSLWFRSYRGPVYFDVLKNRFIFYPSGDVLSLLLDHTGLLWLGFESSGVNRVNKIKSSVKILKAARDTPGASPGDNAKFFYSRQHVPYLFTADGIYNWNIVNNEFKKIYSAGTGEKILDVAASDSVFYIGTEDGLLLFNTFTHNKTFYLTNTKTAWHTGITRLFVDHTGDVWVCFDFTGGVSVFNPKTRQFQAYPYLPDKLNPVQRMATHTGALDQGWALEVYEDRQNTLWIGTNDGGLNKFNRETGKFTSYYNSQNKLMTGISHIYEDRAGRLWAGSFNTGLFEFDRKKETFIKHLNEQTGLLDNFIDGITEDIRGYLWVFTDRGINRIEPNTLSVKTVRYNDIIPGYDMAWSFANLPDGRLAMALKNGLAILDPKDLVDNPYPPMVHLESIVSSNPGADSKTAVTRLRYGLKSIELPYGQNRVQFNYIALHYDNPALNTYAYQLENYDKQLVQAGTVRSVTYNNLSPGTYTFRVIAANSSGVWNKKGDSIIIIIDSPWWLRWWAWLLWTVLFVSAIYAFIAYRSRKLIQDKRVLEHKVHIRTEEVMHQKEEIVHQKEEIESQRDNLEKTLSNLKATQTQLIQSEKMASLGELTAGIAHEIQNPLNFVNNFSEVSTELAQELKEELRSGRSEEAIAIADDLEQNLGKINHHGKRASAIVRGMLEHSRASTGKKEITNINALADEYLRLSYHGLRATDKSFNAEMVTNFDVNLPKISVITQDIGRVFLNLFNNALYAVNQKAKIAGEDYKPELTVTTFVKNDSVVITIKDNGVGIPDTIKEKIMQPFFTTKPTGEGTGLGLSLTYDMVVKGHGGIIQVNSVEGEGSEFIIMLPLN